MKNETMRKLLIVANWKCNPTTFTEAEQLFNSVRRRIVSVKNAEVVICPPFVWLPYLLNSKLGASAFAKSYGGLAFGSQDSFWEEKGAFTGEISPLMLKSLGCRYVIVGHSERRKILKETDEMVNKKLKAALKEGLSPILCIGETQEEKNRGQTENVLENQLTLDLRDISKSEILDSKLSIAYEPVWAIGTGIPCNFDSALGANLFIRKVLNKLYGKETSRKVRILYGGSVKSNNAFNFINRAKMNGFIVGGASLEPEEFIGIVKMATRVH